MTDDIDDEESDREEIAAILQTIAKDGLPGPRDLDVALDAIFCTLRPPSGAVAPTPPSPQPVAGKTDLINRLNWYGKHYFSNVPEARTLTFDRCMTISRMCTDAAAALATPPVPPAPLKAEFTKALPGGKLDDTSFEQIESALDRIDAPCTDASGKWLTLPERIAALKPAPPVPHEVVEALREARGMLRSCGFTDEDDAIDPDLQASWDRGLAKIDAALASMETT